MTRGPGPRSGPDRPDDFVRLLRAVGTASNAVDIDDLERIGAIEEARVNGQDRNGLGLTFDRAVDTSEFVFDP